MDIGAEFDDDFFEQPKVKEEKVPTNYKARVCVPLWFMETGVAERGVSDVLLALKHQADYHYYSKKYPEAAETYEHCLELVPATNNTWKREFMENLARSCLHMDDAQKALEWSLKLDRSSFSPDQKIVAMNLLATVLHKLGKYEEELEALHSCLEAHKSCPEFWLRLALCYAGLFKIDLPENPSLKRALDSETCCVFNSRMNSSHVSQVAEGVTPNAVSECPAESAISVSTTATSNHCSSTTSGEAVPSKCDLCNLGIQLVSSCLIQTKMLIDSGGPNLLDIERDEQIKRKIANCLKHMEVDQAFIDVASQMLGTNFIAQLRACDNTLESEEVVPLNQNAKVVAQRAV